MLEKDAAILRRRVSERRRVERLVVMNTSVTKWRVALRAVLRVWLRVEARHHLMIDVRIVVRVGESVGIMEVQLLLLIGTSIPRRKGNVTVGLRIKLRVVLMDWVQRRVLVDTSLLNGIALAGFCK